MPIGDPLYRLCEIRPLLRILIIYVWHPKQSRQKSDVTQCSNVAQ